MPRPMTSAVAAALNSPDLRPALFLQAQFLTGTIYIWTGRGTLNWNGQAWQGVGSFLSVSAIEETAALDARGVTVSLSAIDPAMLADALQEFQVGAPAVIYLGLFDGAGNLLSDPLASWAGKLDQPVIDTGAETAVITMVCESELIQHNVACDRRYTQDDQQIDYPGDNGFQFVTSIQEMNIYWGRVPSSSNNI